MIGSPKVIVQRTLFDVNLHSGVAAHVWLEVPPKVGGPARVFIEVTSIGPERVDPIEFKKLLPGTVGPGMSEAELWFLLGRCCVRKEQA